MQSNIFFLIIFFLNRYFCNKDSSFGTFIESKPFVLRIFFIKINTFSGSNKCSNTLCITIKSYFFFSNANCLSISIASPAIMLLFMFLLKEIEVFSIPVTFQFFFLK